MYFDFSGIAATDVHRDAGGCRFHGVGHEEGICACGKFCELEDTVFIGFLVLIGFEDMDISRCEGSPCASLIDGSLNITGLGYNREWHGDKRK